MPECGRDRSPHLGPNGKHHERVAWLRSQTLSSMGRDSSACRSAACQMETVGAHVGPCHVKAVCRGTASHQELVQVFGYIWEGALGVGLDRSEALLSLGLGVREGQKACQGNSCSTAQWGHFCELCPPESSPGEDPMRREEMKGGILRADSLWEPLLGGQPHRWALLALLRF